MILDEVIIKNVKFHYQSTMLAATLVKVCEMHKLTHCSRMNDIVSSNFSILFSNLFESPIHDLKLFF